NELDYYSLKDKFVKSNAGVFDRGNHPRGLIKIAAEFFKRGANGFFVEPRHFALLDHLAFFVLRAACHCEHHRSGIFLILRHEEILNFCTAAEGEQQKTGRDWIERAAMTNLSDLQ